MFSYVTVVPALLSGFLWWRKSNTSAKLADILSLYGYSMSLFVPVSVSTFLSALLYLSW